MLLSNISINRNNLNCIHSCDYMILIIHLYAVIWFQVFLSNTNNLQAIIWFQVPNNNPYKTIIALSNYS